MQVKHTPNPPTNEVHEWEKRHTGRVNHLLRNNERPYKSGDTGYR